MCKVYASYGSNVISATNLMDSCQSWSFISDWWKGNMVNNPMALGYNWQPDLVYTKEIVLPVCDTLYYTSKRKVQKG